MTTTPCIAVVYDTSFLMHQRFWRPTLKYLKVVDFVPAEVTREIARHLTDTRPARADATEARLEEKDRLARGARKRVAELIDGGAEEPSLESVVEMDGASPLSADSHTDKKLLGFVQHLAQSGKYAIVYLATDDGGIMNDLVRLKKDGLCVRWLSPTGNNAALEEDTVLWWGPLEAAANRPSSFIEGLVFDIQAFVFGVLAFVARGVARGVHIVLFFSLICWVILQPFVLLMCFDKTEPNKPGIVFWACDLAVVLILVVLFVLFSRWAADE